MKICVVIATYRRAWALPYSIGSLKQQTIPPDKVVFVVKPSGDESEKVIEKHAAGLNYEIIFQKEGNVALAYEIGIGACKNEELILFLDDDAVASKDWIEKYRDFFHLYPEAGGASGIVYRAIVSEAGIELKDELFYDNSIARSSIHRKPLPEYQNYCEWLSVSGLGGNKECNGKTILSALLGGVNMGFRKDAIADCPISQLYRNSRKCLLNESALAYCAKRKGYQTYRILDTSESPKVYHIVNTNSLTRGSGFNHEFWIYYDYARNYWRLRNLGARVSFLHYIIGMLIISRKNPIAAIPA
ncbi:MAG: glycosyltransferase, partial [Fervidicoccaceae archaeon]